MHLRLVLQQPWPVFLLELLLPQDQLDILGSVVGLRFSDVDLREELNVQVVGRLLAVGRAGEGQAIGGQVELERFGGNIGHGDGQEDVVLFDVGRGGALRPED